MEAKAQTKETKAWPVRLYKTSLALKGQKAAISSNRRLEGEKSNKDLILNQAKILNIIKKK